MHPTEPVADEQVIQNADNTDQQPFEPPARSTQNQIREMALAILEGKLVHGAMVDADVLFMVFIPLTFLDISRMPQEVWDSYLPYAVSGREHELGSSINGWPIFTEFRWVHRDDLKTAIRTADAMRQAIRAVEIPTAGDESPESKLNDE